MPKAAKCALIARHARPVKVAVNVANAGAKHAVNVANALSAAQAMPPMAMRPKRHRVQIRTLTPMRQTMAPQLPKTVNAVSVALATATAVTAENALAKHVRTLQTIKRLAMTSLSPAA
jgi:hypothetical protein